MGPKNPGYESVPDKPYSTGDSQPAAETKWSQQSPTVVQATEPPPPIWFTIAKYYVVITAGLTLVVFALLAALLVLAALMAVFTGSGGAFVALLLGSGLLSLGVLYLWIIPIQGALRENKKYLIIHGVVTLLILPTSFVTYNPMDDAGEEASGSHTMAVYEAVTAPSVRYSSLVSGLAEILACWLMAHFIQKKAASRSISMA